MIPRISFSSGTLINFIKRSFFQWFHYFLSSDLIAWWTLQMIDKQKWEVDLPFLKKKKLDLLLNLRCPNKLFFFIFQFLASRVIWSVYIAGSFQHIVQLETCFSTFVFMLFLISLSLPAGITKIQEVFVKKKWN